MPLTRAVAAGLTKAGWSATIKPITEYRGEPQPSISYGILYGTADVYKDCEKAGLPWWNVDNGFFCCDKPNGYYRIGYRNLTPLMDWLPSIDGITAFRRWDALKQDMHPWQRNEGGYILICPPTAATAAFYGVNPKDWVKGVIASLPAALQARAIVRAKGDPGSTRDLFPKTRAVVVYNSNAAVEALLAGIPAVAEVGIVRSWNRLVPQQAAGLAPKDFEIHDRQMLFLHIASYQFTLAEIKAGHPWLTRHWEVAVPQTPRLPTGCPKPAVALDVAPALPTPPVTASLASIPSRAGHLKRVVKTLLPQVTRLNVYLNGYTDTPACLDHPKITVGRGKDLGDAGKFFWEGETEPGYRLTCDDDILYAPDHVQFMIDAIERYGRRAVMSLHGSYLSWPLVSYYRNRRLYHCAEVVGTDASVHVGGTGVMAWHTDTLKVGPADFTVPNMADIWFAVAARRQGVPIVVPAHDKDRLEVLPCKDTIFARRLNDDGAMTAPLKAWQMWDPIPAPHIVGATRFGIAHNGKTYRIRHRRPWDRMCQWSRSTGVFWEEPLLAAIKARNLKGVYIDIGANVGNHALFFAGACPATKVLAVEAAHDTYKLLEENIDANGFGPRIQAIRAIAGAPGQHARLTRPDPTNGAMDMARVDPGGEPCITVDALAAAEVGPVALLKIDAEEFEPDVLKGAVETIKRDSPLLAVEAADEKAFAKQRTILKPLGYIPTIKYGATPVWFWDLEGSD